MESQPERRTYHIVRLIGQGTFGKVYEAVDDLNRKVAIKRVEKSDNFVSREVDILKTISHDNCLKLLDVFYTYPDDDADDRKWQNIVLDYHPSTLSSFLKKRKPETRLVKSMFYQLCLALEHIHSKNICHRDLTPNNVLISAAGEVKMADFGSAKILDADHVSMSYICSRYYRAPELLMGATNYTTKIDIWSAGCILAEMLMGKPIFAGVDTQDQFVKIVLVLGTPSLSDLWAMKKNYKQHLRFPKIEPLYFGDILPADVEDVDNAAHLLNSMLCFNPKTRYSIDDVLNHPFFDEIKEQQGVAAPVTAPAPAKLTDYFEITRKMETCVEPAQM
jgi:glycogen synthase kinase 3 beta